MYFQTAFFFKKSRRSLGGGNERRMFSRRMNGVNIVEKLPIMSGTPGNMNNARTKILKLLGSVFAAQGVGIGIMRCDAQHIFKGVKKTKEISRGQKTDLITDIIKLTGS